MRIVSNRLRGRWSAPYVCIGMVLLLVVLLAACGAYLDIQQVQVAVNNAVMGRLRSHAERTAGHIEHELSEANKYNSLADMQSATWLRVHWARVRLQQPERIYAAITDLSGMVVAHSDNSKEGEQLPVNWARREVLATDPEVVETNSPSLADGRRAYEISVPIMVEGKPIGFYHSGLSARWFDDKLQIARITVVRRWIAVTAGIVLVVLLSIVSLIVIMRRTARLRRELDLAELRRATELTRLVTGLAHEIRNPLNAVGLNLHAAKNRLRTLIPNPDVHWDRMLTDSASEILRIEELMRELLGYVKAEPQPEESVDLTECIHRTTELFQPVFDDEGLELVVILPPREVIIRANGRRIRQVLINLLNNARDSLDGHGRVQVRLTCESKSATLVVEDTGEGIAEGEFDRVFEPFFSTKETGVGLGLTLVRQYVQEIGGNIACANRPQGGTCFRVYVPIECAPVGDRL